MRFDYHGTGDAVASMGADRHANRVETCAPPRRMRGELRLCEYSVVGVRSGRLWRHRLPDDEPVADHGAGPRSSRERAMSAEMTFLSKRRVAHCRWKPRDKRRRIRDRPRRRLTTGGIDLMQSAGGAAGALMVDRDDRRRRQCSRASCGAWALKCQTVQPGLCDDDGEPHLTKVATQDDSEIVSWLAVAKPAPRRSCP